MEKFISHSLEDTKEIAYSVASRCKAGTVIALNGDLGAGKTVFTKFLAEYFEVDEEITSPTFTILEEYQGKLPFYHFDLYRIENKAEFDNLFFEDYWEGEGISIIEWAERAEGLLPINTIQIYIEYLDNESRSFKIEYPIN